jgi:CRP-like cAMP-binding protein
VEALFVPAERRIMGRLVELAPLYASSADSPIELPLTQEDLATFVGTSRATVNQVLRQEERRGTVELRRGKTVLLDIEALRTRAC